MPPKTFLLLMLSVIAAAGVTIALWAGVGLPLIALGSAALLGSLILGWRGLKRCQTCQKTAYWPTLACRHRIRAGSC